MQSLDTLARPRLRTIDKGDQSKGIISPFIIAAAQMEASVFDQQQPMYMEDKGTYHAPFYQEHRYHSDKDFIQYECAWMDQADPPPTQLDYMNDLDIFCTSPNSTTTSSINTDSSTSPFNPWGLGAGENSTIAAPPICHCWECCCYWPGEQPYTKALSYDSSSPIQSWSQYTQWTPPSSIDNSTPTPPPPSSMLLRQQQIQRNSHLCEWLSPVRKYKELLHQKQQSMRKAKCMSHWRKFSLIQADQAPAPSSRSGGSVRLTNTKKKTNSISVRRWRYEIIGQLNAHKRANLN